MPTRPPGFQSSRPDMQMHHAHGGSVRRSCSSSHQQSAKLFGKAPFEWGKPYAYPIVWAFHTSVHTRPVWLTRSTSGFEIQNPLITKPFRTPAKL
eukprot:scaffold267526_cov16-Tisochrysis_lutea.AAC.1